MTSRPILNTRPYPEDHMADDESCVRFSHTHLGQVYRGEISIRPHPDGGSLRVQVYGLRGNVTVAAEHNGC